MRHAPAHSDDAGFTLVELLVSMFVIVTVLLALLAVQMSALRGIAEARQRQQASGIADQLMEGIRAMNLTNNCVAVNPTELAGDPNVTNGRTLTPVVRPSLTESLVTDCAADKQYGSPLTPHTSPQPVRVGTTDYTTRTYVTTASGSRARWLTVLVSWTPASAKPERTIVSRSRLYV